MMTAGSDRGSARCRPPSTGAPAAVGGLGRGAAAQAAHVRHASWPARTPWRTVPRRPGRGARRRPQGLPGRLRLRSGRVDDRNVCRPLRRRGRGRAPAARRPRGRGVGEPPRGPRQPWPEPASRRRRGRGRRSRVGEQVRQQGGAGALLGRQDGQPTERQRQVAQRVRRHRAHHDAQRARGSYGVAAAVGPAGRHTVDP